MGYIAPNTLQDALEHLALDDVSIVAGGTDFFPQLGERKAPDRLLDITRIAELRGISRTATGWRIGAATCWADITRADLPACFDGLKAAAKVVGSLQIQNAGTVAGNLCNASPAADGVPPLLTLNARVELCSLSGTRELDLSDFITGVRKTALQAGEMLTALHVPDLPDAAQSSFIKLGSRKYLVISIAMVAVVLWLDENRISQARIAVGACSPVACRMPKLEAALIGRSAAELAANPAIWSDHLDCLSPIADVRGSAEYRLEAVAELCRRAVFLAVQQ